MSSYNIANKNGWSTLKGIECGRPKYGIGWKPENKIKYKYQST